MRNDTNTRGTIIYEEKELRKKKREQTGAPTLKYVKPHESTKGTLLVLNRAIRGDGTLPVFISGRFKHPHSREMAWLTGMSAVRAALPAASWARFSVSFSFSFCCSFSFDWLPISAEGTAFFSSTGSSGSNLHKSHETKRPNLTNRSTMATLTHKSYHITPNHEHLYCWQLSHIIYIYIYIVTWSRAGSLAAATSYWSPVNN